MGENWLEVTQGPAAGQRLEVERELTVGRAQAGAAALAGDPSLSRSHARFWRAAGGQLLVEDLESANGTFVGGERIERPAVLAVGDTVQLGGATLVVRGDQPAIPGGRPFAQPTRVRARPTSGSVPGARESDPRPSGVGAPGGSTASLGAPSRRLLRLLSLLVLLLVLAVGGLSVALASGGSTSEAVLRNSTVVASLFPVTSQAFNSQVATFKVSSTRVAVSATIDWGDGTAPTRGTIGSPMASGNGAYTRSVSGSHRYTKVATYAVTVTITAAGAEVDSATNLAVVTNCLYETKPTFARSVDLGPVSGQVFFRLPGSATSLPLTAPLEIPVGSQLDATHGSLVVWATTAVPGQLAAGVFDGALFQILQPQALGGLVDLRLRASSTAGCVATNASRVLALLQARVSGSFRTEGRFSAATVRGTEWSTTEQCDGTLTRVQQGVVDVKDFQTGQTIAVSAGHTFLATK